MLIEQSYEINVEYNEARLRSVLGLPKKLIVESTKIYKLRLKFKEATWIHLQYINEVDSDILVEMIFNLNDKVDDYINQLYDFLDEIGARDVNIIEGKFYKYDTTNRKYTETNGQLH